LAACAVIPGGDKPARVTARSCPPQHEQQGGRGRRHPTWRARAVGIYRLRRGGGFAVGALLSGGIADLWGLRAAVWTIAALTAASGLLVAARMYETHRPPSP
jgi:MFS family permease